MWIAEEHAQLNAAKEAIVIIMKTVYLVQNAILKNALSAAQKMVTAAQKK